MNEEAPFAFLGLERLFHERARLGIMTTLAARPEGIGFPELKEMCGLTDGNLARHMQVLEEAKCVNTEPIEGRKRGYRFFLTDLGRERFFQYLSALEDALKAAEHATRRTAAPKLPTGTRWQTSSSSGNQ